MSVVEIALFIDGNHISSKLSPLLIHHPSVTTRKNIRNYNLNSLVCSKIQSSHTLSSSKSLHTSNQLFKAFICHLNADSNDHLPRQLPCPTHNSMSSDMIICQLKFTLTSLPRILGVSYIRAMVCNRPSTVICARSSLPTDVDIHIPRHAVNKWSVC